MPTSAAELDPVRCLITPSAEVTLAASVTGVVAAINVERGDRIASGDQVGRIVSEVERIRLELAEARAADMSAIVASQARLDFFEAQAERTARLADSRTVSESTRQEAEQQAAVARAEYAEALARRDLAEIEVREAEARLAELVIESPMDGTVTARHLEPGEFLAADSPIVTIVNLDRLRVEAFAPARHYAHLEIGQTVTIRPEEPFDTPIPARITVIDRVLDAATGTFGLRAEIDNSDGEVLAGLRCDMEFPAAP